MTKNFNEKSFTFFTINYIVGFGFISTIISLINLNIYGIITMLITALITFGVSLVFSRMANNYKNEYGGSYAYAKKLNNKHFSFFVGWNQYIQGPILASSSPLFLASAASYLTNDETIIWIIRAVSVLIFIILILISTLGLKLNKYIILGSGIVKWAILLTGLIITVYLSVQNKFDIQITQDNANSKLIAYSIFANVILFMYAFGGIEDVSALSKDVKFKNFRKILMISFAFILTFYFVFYIVMLGAGRTNLRNFSQIFQTVLGATGIWLFVIGLLFNGISSKISISISTSRKLVPLAEDGFLFKWLTKKNTRDEYRNAIWFSAIVTIVSMIIFWLIPTLLSIEDFFSSVIELGSVAFLLQYFLTFVTALLLHRKKEVKIPIWEQIIYFIAMAAILLALIVFLFPFVIAHSWSQENTIILVSYILFIASGYGIQLVMTLIKNRKNKKVEMKQDVSQQDIQSV